MRIHGVQERTARNAIFTGARAGNRIQGFKGAEKPAL
jgi:hypothetical protein